MRHFIVNIKHLLFFTLLQLLLACFQPNIAWAQCSDVSAAEREALMDFFNATGGNNWNNNTNWGSTQPVSTWAGITVSADACHVTNISLQNRGLTGSLIDLQLPYLKTLNLNNNQLSGNIPNFSHLNALEELYLSSNQLSGNIPNFSYLPNLQHLWLRINQLSGNVPNFINSPNLASIQLDFNQLSGTLPNLSHLSSLFMFTAAHNQLSGKFPNLTALPINQLWIDNNRFTFAGLEQNQAILNSLSDGNCEYAPQDSIPIYATGEKLYVKSRR
jgi:Leucine-rich repeat (LRR) protein